MHKENENVLLNKAPSPHRQLIFARRSKLSPSRILAPLSLTLISISPIFVYISSRSSLFILLAPFSRCTGSVLRPGINYSYIAAVSAYTPRGPDFFTSLRSADDLVKSSCKLGASLAYISTHPHARARTRTLRLAGFCTRITPDRLPGGPGRLWTCIGLATRLNCIGSKDAYYHENSSAIYYDCSWTWFII